MSESIYCGTYLKHIAEVFLMSTHNIGVEK